MSGEPDPKHPKDSEPRHSDLRDLHPAPSGHRRLPVQSETAWLEALLALSTTLPVDCGERAVARTAVEALAALLPGRAVGLCVAGEEGEQLVELFLPPGVAEDSGHDPSRMFPQLPHEEISPLDPALAGSTLHVAASDNPPLALGSIEQPMMEHALSVVSAALIRARAFTAALDANRELRLLQAQMIQTEKLASLGQIVAGVVHELNNPLTSIVAYSDYLEKRAVSQGQHPDDIERLRRIAEAAARILKFSRDLVAYARPATEQPGPVLLNEVIDKALVFCEHELAESSIDVERSLHGELPPVRGVPGQLTQVFVNLFTNASHAMRERGGNLRVQARYLEEEESVQIVVADDGVGIDEADLGQIFEPFFTTKREGRGTGLGLSIVRDIIDGHGGRLLADSSPGCGATFTLTLPIFPIRKSTRPPPAG